MFFIVYFFRMLHNYSYNFIKVNLLSFIFWNYIIYLYILIFLDKMFYEALKKEVILQYFTLILMLATIYIYIYIYIYILKSVYLGSKVLFRQVLLKMMEHCLLFFYCTFSTLFEK